MNKEPRQFTCFDDHDNDGWGNSTLNEPIYEPELKEEDNNPPEPDIEDYPVERENPVTVVNNGDYTSTNSLDAENLADTDTGGMIGRDD